ncbi:MAG: hypothetical protein AB1486_14400 [Planctomycetota bacterium]
MSGQGRGEVAGIPARLGDAGAGRHVTDSGAARRPGLRAEMRRPEEGAPGRHHSQAETSSRMMRGNLGEEPRRHFALPLHPIVFREMLEGTRRTAGHTTRDPFHTAVRETP